MLANTIDILEITNSSVDSIVVSTGNRSFGGIADNASTVIISGTTFVLAVSSEGNGTASVLFL